MQEPFILFYFTHADGLTRKKTNKMYTSSEKVCLLTNNRWYQDWTGKSTQGNYDID